MKSLQLLDDMCRLGANWGTLVGPKQLADFRVMLLADLTPALEALKREEIARRLAWPEFTVSATAELAEADE